MNSARLRKHKEVLEEYISPNGKRVLDVGCGEGALVRYFAKRGAEAEGLDPLGQAIERAQAAEPVEGASYRLGGGQELPYPNESFDVVCFFNSLHHVPTHAMAGALEEARRVLRPGGLIYVLEPVAAGAYFELMRPVDDETEVRKQAIAALAAFGESAGLEALEEIHYLAPYRYKSFDELEYQVLSVDPTRAARLDAHREAIRTGFEAASADDDEGGYLFQYPMRLNRYIKAA